MNLHQLFRNKVVFYLSSRYITYFIQFVTSIIVAVELGPYFMGIWGFILLILQYFQQIHFGIANSFNVLYVHHRDCEQKCNDYIGNSLMLVSYLSVFVVCFYAYYLLFGLDSVEKYHANRYLFWTCLIAILQYFIQFFTNLFRVKNQLLNVAFCQSIIVFLNFFCVFLFKGEQLIVSLLTGYIIGGVLCILLAFMSGSIPAFSQVRFSLTCQGEILKKGLFLFLYNSCFYFIIISIRTIISGCYSVEEFGMFTFSFTLAHAILLLLEALSFIIYPKVIGILSITDNKQVHETIKMLRNVFVTLSHFLIYLAIVCFPYLLSFFPKYNGALTALNLIALAILMNYNGFGYLELLISRNQEKTSAFLSFVALVINCIVALFIVYVLHCSFSFVILATLVTYLFFSMAAMFFGEKLIGGRMTIESWFPLRLSIPYVVALIISIVQRVELVFIPLLLFFILNWRQLFEIKNTAILLLQNPDKVNL